MIRGLLLDLDGTYLDTLGDMGGALNQLRREEGLDVLPLEVIRPWVSHGSTGLIRLGFGACEEATFERLRERFLTIYRTDIAGYSRPFTGFDRVLEYLREHDLRWGIVTNKPAWLTEPLLAALAITPTSHCVVSGDTVAQRKPHPLPLLHAAERLDLAPAQCVYVGDAERDIQAGRAAGMRTLVAGWGYLGAEDTMLWEADGWLESPADLMTWLTSESAIASRGATCPDENHGGQNERKAP